MATFIEDGDPGCTLDNWNRKQPYAAGPSADPATFDPARLDFGNWADSFDALGVRNAVMTAKHGCGFLLWPTATRLPDGSEYDYCVGKRRSSIKYDLIGAFAQAMAARDISIGFYYSLTNNYFLNVAGKVAKNADGWLPGMARNVTQAEFERIAMEQLTELWTSYGNFSGECSNARLGL